MKTSRNAIRVYADRDPGDECDYTRCDDHTFTLSWVGQPWYLKRVSDIFASCMRWMHTCATFLELLDHKPFWPTAPLSNRTSAELLAEHHRRHSPWGRWMHSQFVGHVSD